MEPARTIDIPSGETIGYRVREGGDVPVVLLHGNMTSSYHWDLVFEAMDERYTLYAMDMRGFGASSYEEPVESLHDFAADVEAFVDAFDLEPFHLWGWSTGGGVAVSVAASLPDRVRSLVLMAPVSTRGYPIYAKDENGQPTDEVAVEYETIANDPVQVAPMVAANEAGDREAYREVWNSLIYTHDSPEEARYEAYVDDMLTQRNSPTSSTRSHTSTSPGRRTPTVPATAPRATSRPRRWCSTATAIWSSPERWSRRYSRTCRRRRSSNSRTAGTPRPSTRWTTSWRTSRSSWPSTDRTHRAFGCARRPDGLPYL